MKQCYFYIIWIMATSFIFVTPVSGNGCKNSGGMRNVKESENGHCSCQQQKCKRTWIERDGDGDRITCCGCDISCEEMTKLLNAAQNTANAAHNTANKAKTTAEEAGRKAGEA